MAFTPDELRQLKETLTEGLKDGFEKSNFGQERVYDDEGNLVKDKDQIENILQTRKKEEIKEEKNKKKSAKRTAIAKGVLDIANEIVNIIAAVGERDIALRKASAEKNTKLTQAELQKQTAAISFGMKGITDGFTKNAHEMAYEATKGGYDLAKTMIDTSMQMTIASKTYAKDVKQANNQFIGSIVGSAAVIGATIGTMVGGPVGTIIGGAIGAIGGAFVSAWNKLTGLDIKRRELDIQIANQVKELSSSYIDSFKQTASSWDDLYKSTTDMVLKINDAGVKFGRTIGFGSEKFGNTMLKLADTGVTEDNQTLARIFGNEVDKIPEYMASYIDTSGRNVGMSATDLGNIMGTGRLFGMSGTESASLYGSMNIFNTSISSASDSMGIMYHQITRMGLSSKKFGKDLVQNLKMAEKYNFKGGVENMMKLTKWAQQTRFNLDKAASFSDSIMNDSLSGALEKTAKLQVLGGSAAMYSDPFGMLYEAGADVGSMAKRMAAMFNDITGTFNKKTGETEFSWYENRMIAARAQAMGMDAGEVKNMIRQNNKQGAINRVLRGSDLSKEDKLALGNRATYNKEKGIWEVKDIHGETHDIREYTKNGGLDINDILPADTQESILEVNRRSLSVQERIDNTTEALAKKLGVTEQDVIQERAKRESELHEKTYLGNWDKTVAAFEAAGEHSEKMFETQLKISEYLANNLDVLKNIYTGIEKQASEVVDNKELWKSFKEATNKFADGSETWQNFLRGLVDSEERKKQKEKEIHDKYKNAKTSGEYIAYEQELRNNGSTGAANAISKTNQITTSVTTGVPGHIGNFRDSYGETNGGILHNASNVKSINDGTVNVKNASQDQYLAAMPNGPIDKILQQLIPGLQALLKGQNGNSGSNTLTLNGRIELSQNGSTFNLVEMLKNDPAAATKFITVLTKMMETNSNGKPTYSYKMF